MPRGPAARGAGEGPEARWTKPCAKCGARMVKVAVDPVQIARSFAYPVQWWCACGAREPAGALPVKDPSAEIRAKFAKETR